MTTEQWGIHTLHHDVKRLAEEIDDSEERANICARARTVAQALHLEDVDAHLQHEAYTEALSLIRTEWKDGEYTPPYDEHAVSSD